MVAVIFCLTFTSTLDLLGPLTLRRALPTYKTKCPLSFLSHCQYSVLCKGFPLQYLDDGLHDCHSSHLHLHCTSHCPLESQYRPPVYPPLPPDALKKSSALFAEDNSLHCSGCRPLFRKRERGTPPFALGLCWYNHTSLQQRTMRRAPSFLRRIVSTCRSPTQRATTSDPLPTFGMSIMNRSNGQRPVDGSIFCIYSESNAVPMILGAEPDATVQARPKHLSNDSR